MGFFSDLFGGESDTAIKEQRRMNREQREFIKEQGEIARDDINRLYPQGIYNSREAMQEAIQLGRRAPMQRSAVLDKGNYRAQAAILGGLGQANNAIMGRPLEVSENIMENHWSLRPRGHASDRSNTGANTDSAAWKTEMPSFLQVQNQTAPNADPLAALLQGQGAAGLTPEQIEAIMAGLPSLA